LGRASLQPQNKKASRHRFSFQSLDGFPWRALPRLSLSPLVLILDPNLNLSPSMASCAKPEGIKIKSKVKVKRRMKMEDRRGNRRHSIQGFLGKAVSDAIDTRKT
jgi:hypothetical protein